MAQQTLKGTKNSQVVEKSSSNGEKKNRPITPLSELKPGEWGEVVAIKANLELKSRLLSMGLTSGTEVKVDKTAPLGDPMDILVRGYHLSLRIEEAEKICVKRIKK